MKYTVRCIKSKDKENKSDELLFSWFEKNANKLLDQTKTRPEETLDLKLTKSEDSLLFNTPLKSEKGCSNNEKKSIYKFHSWLL